jgi:glycosyltransferase involved in cell wall biosynthesis
MSFDSEFPSTLDDKFRIRIKNSTRLHSLIDCDLAISPTNWRRSRYPDEIQSKINVVHDGIGTDLVKPDASVWVEVNRALRLRAGDEIVTYVARNLVPYRGIHILISILPYLQAQRLNARVIIAGGDDVSYGRRLPQGQTYRRQYCAEVQDRVDWQKVHFVGKLPYSDYLKVLQGSAAHVYLTYTFVLSWSMLEAMAAGCLVIASDTAPVKEVIEDEVNGILIDFFDPKGLASKITDTLADPDGYTPIRDRARQTIVERCDLKPICLPKLLGRMHLPTGPERQSIRAHGTQ